ncbi:terpene synthase-like [Leptidea sinapis]|uniref:terpene synthase-like n=1 Tax=Leptidea sinapis TaxID=189913 RepID=UPI00213E74C9|nr:terpene synthase-like [Leptidea sinapis]
MIQDEEECKLYLEKELLAPHEYLLKLPSKEKRLRIAKSLNYWLGLPKEKYQFIVETIQSLHTGSLLIDDIQDNTLVRRSVPAAHLIYGEPLTSNASMHVMTLCLEKLLSLGHPMIGKLYCENFLENIRGQGKEIYWRERFQCPSEKQYKYMCMQKTGNMFNLAYKVMQLFSNDKRDFTKLVKNLGLYFQLCDDYWNLVNIEALEELPDANIRNKSYKNNTKDVVKTNGAKAETRYFCEDLTEGKFTLPIIHAAQQEGGEVVLNILRQRTRDPDRKKFCVSVLESLGSIKYTRDQIIELEKWLRNEINNFGGNSELSAIIDEMTLYL